MIRFTGSALFGAGDDKVKNLFLDQSGESICNDIYAKEGDIIDSVGGGNIYKSFIDEMNGLKTDGTIDDWKPVAYDWRLSLDDFLNKGANAMEKYFTKKRRVRHTSSRRFARSRRPRRRGR